MTRHNYQVAITLWIVCKCLFLQFNVRKKKGINSSVFLPGSLFNSHLSHAYALCLPFMELLICKTKISIWLTWYPLAGIIWKAAPFTSFWASLYTFMKFFALCLLKKSIEMIVFSVSTSWGSFNHKCLTIILELYAHLWRMKRLDCPLVYWVVKLPVIASFNF